MRIRWFFTHAVLLLTVGSSAFWAADAFAQERDGWTPPFRLSSPQGEASEGQLEVDQEGYVHLLWSESGFENKRSVINYSRFDGKDWSIPVAVYSSWPGSGIGSLATSLDSDGTLHLIWTEGNAGPIFYSRVAIEQAFNARNWKVPTRIDVPAFKVDLQVDASGFIHIMYINFYGEFPGLYTIRSENNAKTWTYPMWLDPDIPPIAAPSWLDTALDDKGVLHVLWSYADLSTSGFISRWIRYTHSTDGGETWTEPFSIDSTGILVDELRAPNPGIIIQGETVHVIWGAANTTNSDGINRRHRLSNDRGTTWEETRPVFGGLEGQASGDGLAVDSQGRVHFATQVRWPQGIHYSIWDENDWTAPVLAYLIRQNATEEFAGRIHASHVRLAINTDDQIILIFKAAPSEPQSVLFAMHQDLAEAPSFVPVDVSAEPALVPTALPISTEPVLEPTATSAPPQSFAEEPVPEEFKPPAPGEALWVGLVPAAVVVLGFLLFRLIIRR